MRFSASRLQTWMDCQLQARFKYVDKLPQRQGGKQSFGVIIHHCLEQLVKDADVDAAVERFKYLWEDPTRLEDRLAIETWPRYTTYSSLLGKGVIILQSAAELRSWDVSEVLGTEIPFVVPMGRHEINGFVDLLELRQSGNGKLVMRVCDYKTSSYKPSQAKLRNNVQFTIYDYATRQREFWVGDGSEEAPGLPDGERLFEEYIDVPRRPIWIHLWNYQELDAGERTQADFERVYMAFDQIERAQESGIYVPDISADTCGLCDFTEACGITIPTPQEIAAEPDAWL